MSFEEAAKKIAELFKSNDMIERSDRYFVVLGGEYGWGYDALTTPIEKLNYIFTFLYRSHGAWAKVDGYDYEIFEETFKDSNDVAAILFNKVKEILDCEYDGITFVLEPDSYIDHQSATSDGESILEFHSEDDTMENLISLVFGNSEIEIKSDN